MGITTTFIADPNREWRIWNSSEIYTLNGSGQYVPNVDDLIWDINQGFKRVTSVDYTTGLSTNVSWTPPSENGVETNNDILLGNGPGPASVSFRVFYNSTVTPHVLAADSSLHIYGNDNQYIQYFLGTDVSVNAKPISIMYDQSGNSLGPNIPLELVATDNVSNLSIKTPQVGYTLQKLNDGDTVSIVTYKNSGDVSNISVLLVKDTAFIKSNNSAYKYIVAISLKTPFLSPTDPKTIVYPVNMPVSSLNLMGVVTYSDGSSLTLPVDGTKFSLFGLENYIATEQGQLVPLVLSYSPSSTEFNYITSQTPAGNILEQYTAMTAIADGAYSVKLFVSAVWNGSLNGYSLDYWLYNLDRQYIYNVTNLVQINSNSGSFNPILYGQVQKLSVSINMNSVDSLYANYRFVQSFSITLVAPGDSQTSDNWTVSYTPGQTPQYGVGTLAKTKFVNANNWQIDLTCGMTNLTDWLNKVYYATQPLFDATTEEKAPAPNIMALVYGNFRIEIPVSQWNVPAVITGPILTEGKPLYLQWISRNAANDLQLGCSGLIIHIEN